VQRPLPRDRGASPGEGRGRVDRAGVRVDAGRPESFREEPNGGRVRWPTTSLEAVGRAATSAADHQGGRCAASPLLGGGGAIHPGTLWTVTWWGRRNTSWGPLDRIRSFVASVRSSRSEAAKPRRSVRWLPWRANSRCSCTACGSPEKSIKRSATDSRRRRLRNTMRLNDTAFGRLRFSARPSP